MQGLPDYVTVSTVSVVGRPDSGEENVANGAMYITSSDLEFMIDGGNEQIIAIRFPSVDVSTSVNKAWMLFDVDEVSWESGQAVTIGIYGELSVNSAPIGAAARDISSRTVTNAMALWMPGATNVVHEEL